MFEEEDDTIIITMTLVKGNRGDPLSPYIISEKKHLKKQFAGADKDGYGDITRQYLRNISGKI